ncbi:MAG: fused MFS/spermidine synthase [Candidatus Firestonebacteria bacterium]
MAYIGLLFFISGISGLVYEVVWTRMLTLTFGNTTYSATTVLASYMGGLALGSFLAGKYIDKAKNLIKIYGILELLIAFVALLIPFALDALVPLYKTIGATLNPSLFIFGLIRFFISFLMFLLPTTLMGATLPVLSKALINSKKNLGERLGFLYSINTLGAVFGCFLSGFFLISLCGIKASIYLAAFLNLIIGIFAVFLSSREEGKAARAERAEKGVPTHFHSKKIALLAAIVFGISGFASLGYEVVWTRNLIFVFTSSVYSFTVMLMVFLAGIALGSLVFSRIVDREKDPVLLLSLIQLMIGLFSFIALYSFKLFYYVFEKFVMTDISAISLGEFSFAALYFIVLIFPSTFFMGAAFPVTGKLVAGDIKTLGRSIGNVYSLNTIGAILGAFTTGFLLVPLIHGQNTLGLLIIINAAVGFFFFCLAGKRKKNTKLIYGMGVFVAALGISLFFQEDIFTSIVKFKVEKFAGPVKVIFSDEDVEAKVSVFEEAVSKERTLWINGLIVAGKCLDTKLMAHLPPFHD